MSDEPRPPEEGGGGYWPPYNRSQTSEKTNVIGLLHKLCQTVTEELPSLRRPRWPLREILFCLIYKVYANLASRPLEDDLERLQKEGYLSRVPHFNCLPGYMRNKEVTPFLERLIGVTGLVLRNFETDFAVDSTKLYKPRCYIHVDKKTGRKSRRRERLKLHLICGTETRIVTAARVSSMWEPDLQHFRPLFDRTLDLGFNMHIIRGDKGYWSPTQMLYVRKKGVEPVFTPKRRDRRKGGAGQTGVGGNTRRGQVETVNFMISAKFRKRLLSVDPVAQVNEAFCKVIGHNLRVLNIEAHLRGITVDFQ
jgi:hypothetical protein